MVFKQKIRAISFRSTIVFDVQEKVYLYIVKSSNVSIFELAKLLKPYVRRNVGYLVYKQYRVIAKYINQRLGEFQELSKYRWVPKYNLQELKKYSILAQDISPIAKMLEKYSPYHNFWFRTLGFRPIDDRKTILLIVHKVDSPIELHVLKLIVNLYYRCLGIVDTNEYKIPDYILLLLIGAGNRIRWVVVKTEEQTPKDSLKFIRVLWRLLLKVEKRAQSEGLDAIHSVESLYHESQVEVEQESDLDVHQHYTEKVPEDRKEVTKVVDLLGKKVEVTHPQPKKTTKESKKELVQRVSNVAKAVLTSKDTQKVKTVLVKKDIETTAKTLYSLAKERTLEKTTRTPDGKSHDSQKQWEQLLKSSIDKHKFAANRKLSLLYSGVEPVVVPRQTLDYYTVNRTITKVSDHARETYEVAVDIFYELVRSTLDSLGLKLVKWKVENRVYKNLDYNAQSNGKKIDIEWTDGTTIRKASFLFPEVDEDGKLFLSGNWCSITGQLYPMPIQNTKKGIVRVHTLNGVATFERKKNYCLLSFVGQSLTPPLLYCVISNEPNPFDSLMRRYKVKYDIWDTEKDPSRKYDKDKYHVIPVSETKRVVIEKNSLTPLGQFVVDSLFAVTRVYNIYKNIKEPEVLSPSWWSKVIDITNDNPSAAYFVIQRSKVFIDSITKYFLRQTGYPDEWPELMLYINDLLFEKPDLVSHSKTDLTKMRLRTYEQIVHTAYKLFIDQVLNYLKNRDLYGQPKGTDIKAEQFLSILLSGHRSFRLLENANPLEEIVIRNKLDYRGYEGLSEESATLDNRYLHETYKGVIDPVDTPEGQNIGVVNTAANGFTVLTREGLLVKPPIDKLKGRLFGPTISIVPFANRNEASRLLMSSSQLKQAVLINGIQSPAIMTGYERIIEALSSAAHRILSPCDGVVTDVRRVEQGQRISIRCETTGKLETITVPDFYVGRSGQGKHTYYGFDVIVKPGDKVRKDQTIARSHWFDSLGNYRYGRNVLAVLGNFRGLTYEDGIVVSEELVPHLTSKHIEIYKCYLTPEDKLLYFAINSIGQKVESGETLVTVDSKQFFDYLDSELFENTEVVVEESGYRIVSHVTGVVRYVKVFVSQRRISSMFTTNSERAKQFIRTGPDPNVAIYYKNKPLEGMYIEIGIEHEMPLQVGDKLVTRHANKGVVSMILPPEEMPLVKDLNQRAQIVFNGEAIIDRAITGIIFEIYASRLSKLCGELFLKTNWKDEKDVDNTLTVLSKLSIFGPHQEELIKRLSYDDRYREFVKRYVKESGGFFPIIVPPVEDKPSLSEITKLLHFFNIPLRNKIYIPYLKTEVEGVAGWVYTLKLEHMSFSKLKARSVGPYDPRTGQAKRGKLGGQRLGELDFFQLISWDVQSIIRELHIENPYLKRQLYRKVIETGSVSLDDLKQGILTEQTVTTRTLDVLAMGMLVDL